VRLVVASMPVSPGSLIASVFASSLVEVQAAMVLSINNNKADLSV